MLSTPFICCSIGVATACSRVCASAPTYVACNLISGGTMLGKCATGRLAMGTAPTITIRMAITIAAIWKGSNDANRARVWIHLPVRQQDFAFLRVDTAVSQDQFERVSEKTDGVLAGNGAALFLCEEVLPFADRKIGFDRFELRN